MAAEVTDNLIDALSPTDVPDRAAWWADGDRADNRTIGKATIAIGAELEDLALMGARPVAPPSLCIEVKNIGLEEVTVTEVGLMAGEYGPQIPMVDPLLHDNGSWPRRLKPGDTVIAHFGSGLGKHPVLHKVRRAYALTALRPFQASAHRA